MRVIETTLPTKIWKEAFKLHGKLDWLTAEQRRDVFRVITEGYCKHCGSTCEEDICCCQNDD